MKLYHWCSDEEAASIERSGFVDSEHEEATGVWLWASVEDADAVFEVELTEAMIAPYEVGDSETGDGGEVWGWIVPAVIVNVAPRRRLLSTEVRAHLEAQTTEGIASILRRDEMS